MAFSEGTRGTVECRLLQGGYAALGLTTYFQGKHVANVIARPLEGGYAALGLTTYFEGKHVANVIARPSDDSVLFLPGLAVYGAGVHCQFASLPPVPGDNTVHIGFGQVLDFDAIPRYGFDPLTVQFINKSNGTITEYYWRFGDGKKSYHSEPAHIYARGLYDVTLRIKVGNRYLSLRKRKYILVLPGGLVVSRTTRCIRHAILPEQGIGFYEMPAAAMPMPEAGIGALAIYDTNNQIRGLILDAKTGKWYDVTTRDGPTGTGLVKKWTGIDGTEFSRSLKFREDRGTDEKDFERLIESHIFMRPETELNRTKDGYDTTTGFPTGMAVDLDFFVDGEPTTPAASLSDIPLNGDLKTDRKVEGKRIQMQVSVNRGAHFILNRLNIYDSSKRAAAPDDRIMTEMDYQEELAQTRFWMSYYNDSLINRTTGQDITLSGVSAVEGPVSGGGNTAVDFSEAITPGSVIASSSSVLFWLKGTAALTINGVSISLTDLGTSNGFTLKYASGITGTGNIVLTPTGPAQVSDFRVIEAALSAGAKTYYLNNVTDNSGDIVLP